MPSIRIRECLDCETKTIVCDVCSACPHCHDEECDFVIADEVYSAKTLRRELRKKH